MFTRSDNEKKDFRAMALWSLLSFSEQAEYPEATEVRQKELESAAEKRSKFLASKPMGEPRVKGRWSGFLKESKEIV